MNQLILRRAHKIALVTLLAIFISSCAWLRPAPIEWNDTRWCVPPKLKVVLRKIAYRYGPVRIHSTHRWPLENKRKGGKPKSYHLTCRAVDFSVKGDPPGVLEFIPSSPRVGGYARYPQGFYHIDTGPRRTWKTS